MILYLIPVNALALLLMTWDKLQAKKHRRRIPEALLLGVALLGGSPGAGLAMVLLPHKTRKPLFSIGIPVMLMIHVTLYLIFCK